MIFIAPVALELDKFDGVLPARTTQKIRATIFPARRVDYNVSLSYELLSEFGKCRLKHC